MIYDRLGRWYDVLTAFGEGRLREAGLKLLYPQPGEVALEVGCGTGHALLGLARGVGDGGKVVGIDLSRSMLEVARRRVSRAGLVERVTLVLGDARRLPLPTGAVDLVFLSFTLELFGDADARRVLAECRRVLGKAGRLGVVALDARGEPSALRRAYEWAHRQWPEVVDCRPIGLLELLETEGFEVTRSVEDGYWGLTVGAAVARPRASVTAPAD